MKMQLSSVIVCIYMCVCVCVCVCGVFQDHIYNLLLLHRSHKPFRVGCTSGQGAYQYVGVVQVGHIGMWGVMCDQWTTREAQVVCRQLNYNGGTLVPSISNIIVGSAFWSAGVRCAGNESRLGECNHNSWTGSPACLPNFSPVAIQCSSEFTVAQVAK